MSISGVVLSRHLSEGQHIIRGPNRRTISVSFIVEYKLNAIL
ncbi:predicted protein [Botrytis cinerea T4]|uniref:Uncharacterized protein n=1 Tax=Botryotinia fuckeliana (strain T4) TaxID=999810 RepID=G2YS75_BOTF4|nr:predicted protein [Botrytis cinerea T4]